MYVKLFVFGRSGAGKSRTTRHVAAFIASSSWTVQRFNDYDILKEMASVDKKRFRLVKDGFDVLEPSALDEALQTLDSKVSNHCNNIESNQSNSNELIIIEFARPNYNDAFKKLSQGVKQNAFFLLINTDFGTCKARIQMRMASPDHNSNDDHNVSNFAMNRFFRKQIPPEETTITTSLTTLTNNNEWDDFTKELEPFIRRILNISDSNT